MRNPLQRLHRLFSSAHGVLLSLSLAAAFIAPSCVKKGNTEGECQTSNDCSPGRLCVETVCRNQCDEDDDCGAAEMCQPQADAGLSACVPDLSPQGGSTAAAPAPAPQGFCAVDEYVKENECVTCPEYTENPLKPVRQANQGGAGGLGGSASTSTPKWRGDDRAEENTSCSPILCAFNEEVTDHVCEACNEDQRTIAQDEIGADDTGSCIDFCDENFGKSCDEFDAGGFFKALPANDDDRFGHAIALNDDYLIIGAPLVDYVSGEVENTRSGAVYVYKREGDAWTWAQTILPPNPEKSYDFGRAVSISGPLLAVAQGSGAFVYRLVDGIWGKMPSGEEIAPEATLWAPEGAKEFALSIELDGTSLIVGAPNSLTNSEPPVKAGAVYYYRRSTTDLTQAGNWMLSQTVQGTKLTEKDQYGVTHSFRDEDTLVIGAPLDDSGTEEPQGEKNQKNSGAVYVYKWLYDEAKATEQWVEVAYLKSHRIIDSTNFGRSVSLSGDLLAISSSLNDAEPNGISYGPDFDKGFERSSTNHNLGAVHIFSAQADGSWEQEALLKASNAEYGDRLGERLTLQGNVLAVSALQEDSSDGGVQADQSDNEASSSGAVYLFGQSGGTWKQIAYLKAPQPRPGDAFGNSLALNSNELAIGVPFDDSPDAGFALSPRNFSGRTDSGAVYMRSWTSSLLTP